ncbi:MAG: D-alanyl-D-alanine carboxypeptidase family protein [Microthrixaceae bacterium]
MRTLTPKIPMVVALLVATAAVSLPAAPAGAAPTQSDPASEAQRLAAEREEVRAQRASKAAQIDALKADDDKVSAALSDLNQNVSSQQDLLLEAQNGVQDAERQAKEAEQRAKDAGDKLGQLREDVADRAAEAFVTMPAHSFGAASDQSDPTQLMTRRTYLNLVAGNDRSQVEDLRATEQDLGAAQESAASATERAQERRAEVSSRLAKLQAAQAEQLDFQEAVANRIASASAEAEGLAEADEELSTELVQQQLALTAQLKKAEEQRKAKIAALEAAKLKQAAELSAAAEAQKAAAAQASSSSSSGGGGGGSSAAAPAASGGTPAAISGSGNIVSVGGIRVHRSIAGNLSSLLGAASAAGINFGGGGFRDPADQVRVRRNNCGSSSYAIYQAPASSCRPPTAIPGTSQHERGLAIDFTMGGSALRYGSSGYNWLKANAARYGFHNLPGEPWHWSTTGR